MGFSPIFGIQPIMFSFIRSDHFPLTGFFVLFLFLSHYDDQ